MMIHTERCKICGYHESEIVCKECTETVCAYCKSDAWVGIGEGIYYIGDMCKNCYDEDTWCEKHLKEYEAKMEEFLEFIKDKKNKG